MIFRCGFRLVLGIAFCASFAGTAEARDRQADLNDIQYACGQPPDDGDTFGGQPYRYAVISVLDATEDGSESSKKYLVDSRYAEMESSPYMACVFGRRLQQISVVPARTPPPPPPSPPPPRPSTYQHNSANDVSSCLRIVERKDFKSIGLAAPKERMIALRNSCAFPVTTYYCVQGVNCGWGQGRGGVLAPAAHFVIPARDQDLRWRGCTQRSANDPSLEFGGCR